ncbi:MAG: enoyl-CoA hydratase/isomerase family protein [Thermoanaerobaculia bacterium]|nr:enoyl-CoA hydratase/isomerase family protein [Thermoanaerobaculia bacterium]
MSNIQMERDGGVGLITIDRKERFNSLDVETARDLRKAGLQFARDASVRAVVLRGAGGIFCSGADLKYIRAGGDARDLGYLQPERGAVAQGADPAFGSIFKQILEYIHSTISEIRRAAKPFIAAVDGVAAAGGFGLAMSCDLVFASERASFEWAYSKTGLTGAESSTFFLPRLLGFRRAMDLLLLNPRLDARRAYEMGLVSGVFPTDVFDAEVMAVARKLAAGPTEALGIAKQLMNQAAGMDRLDYHLDRELENLARIADGSNFAEGLAAFFEKRPPEFAER